VVSVWSRRPNRGRNQAFLHGWRVAARNRIIAGLCAVTIVVEARARSGALITADFALEEGREVFAVPGDITSSLSAGTNELIRLGATPLTASADVLEALGVPVPAPAALELGPTAAALLERLPASPDELVAACGLRTPEVAAGLAELELLRLVAQEEGIYRALRTS
jgi:DNA processing protein